MFFFYDLSIPLRFESNARLPADGSLALRLVAGTVQPHPPGSGRRQRRRLSDGAQQAESRQRLLSQQQSTERRIGERHESVQQRLRNAQQLLQVVVAQTLHPIETRAAARSDLRRRGRSSVSGSGQRLGIDSISVGGDARRTEHDLELVGQQFAPRVHDDLCGRAVGRCV